MIQVAIAASTISPNRIVYADGSVNLALWLSSRGSAGAATCSVNPGTSVLTPTTRRFLAAAGSGAHPGPGEQHRGRGRPPPRTPPGDGPVAGPPARPRMAFPEAR